MTASTNEEDFKVTGEVGFPTIEDYQNPDVLFWSHGYDFSKYLFEFENHGFNVMDIWATPMDFLTAFKTEYDTFGKFELYTLDYPLNGLDPIISEEIMTKHHGSVH